MMNNVAPGSFKSAGFPVPLVKSVNIHSGGRGYHGALKFSVDLLLQCGAEKLLEACNILVVATPHVQFIQALKSSSPFLQHQIKTAPSHAAPYTPSDRASVKVIGIPELSPSSQNILSYNSKASSLVQFHSVTVDFDMGEAPWAENVYLCNSLCDPLFQGDGIQCCSYRL